MSAWIVLAIQMALALPCDLVLQPPLSQETVSQILGQGEYKIDPLSFRKFTARHAPSIFWLALKARPLGPAFVADHDYPHPQHHRFFWYITENTPAGVFAVNLRFDEEVNEWTIWDVRIASEKTVEVYGRLQAALVPKPKVEAGVFTVPAIRGISSLEVEEETAGRLSTSGVSLEDLLTALRGRVQSFPYVSRGLLMPDHIWVVARLRSGRKIKLALQKVNRDRWTIVQFRAGDN
jgi:hypothetical protein